MEDGRNIYLEDSCEGIFGRRVVRDRALTKGPLDDILSIRSCVVRSHWYRYRSFLPSESLFLMLADVINVFPM